MATLPRIRAVEVRRFAAARACYHPNMRWSWLSLVVVACSDSAASPSDPPVTFTPQERGDSGAQDVDAGCSADLMTDPSHCGSCDVACPQGDHQKASCLAGKCVAACEAGFDDCDGAAANGCEKPVSDDPENCGACGRTCATCGEAVCAAGACKPKELVTGQTGAYDIGLDATRVYWSNKVTGGAIRRALKNGTNVQGVASGDNPADILVTGTYVYWTRPNVGNGEGVNRTPKPDIVGPFPGFVSGQDSPGGLAIDAEAIYWTRNVGLAGTLVRCANCNGGALDIATSLPSAGRLVADETSIVVLLGDAVVTYGKTGQSPKTLAVKVDQHDVKGLASDGTNVFVANATSIVRMPKDASPQATLVASPARAIRYLDGHLYYASATTLARIDADATHPVTLASSLTAPGAMAVDETCAYFIDGDKILTVTK